jgi:hypothetical protein
LKDNEKGNLEIIFSDEKEAYKNQAKSLVNKYDNGLKIIDLGTSKLEGED